jgi:hypothetical protein
MTKLEKNDERYGMLLRMPKIRSTVHGSFVKFKKNRAHYNKYLLVNLIDANSLNYVLYKIHNSANGELLLNTDLLVVH